MKTIGWLRDDHVHPETGLPYRMTFGSGGVDGRFGAAYPSGTASLHWWDGTTLLHKRVQCRSHRRAVRLLRMHLKGYNV